jgi:hypothetical protein
MTIQIDVWQLIEAASGVLVFFLTIVAFLGRMLVNQFKGHVDEKFQTMEKARNTASTHWDQEFKKLDGTARKLETDFLNWKAELPLQYVRREDYVRGQTVIESKIDSVMSKLEILQIQGAKHG